MKIRGQWYKSQRLQSQKPEILMFMDKKRERETIRLLLPSEPPRDGMMPTYIVEGKSPHLVYQFRY